MTAFSTVHLFGFGTAQIIGKDVNKQVPFTALTKLTAFVDHVKTFKPADVTLTDFHVIHIFENMDVRYLGKKADGQPMEAKTSFSVKWADVDAVKLGALVDEIAAYVAPVAPAV